jgi:hypothetical protein
MPLTRLPSRNSMDDSFRPDRFRDHPLLYHVSPEFVLVYSVGRNGRDDAARSRLDDPNNDPGADDIVIRLRPRLKH